MNRNHRHRDRDPLDLTFGRCLNPADCNPAAHGNIERMEECTCGAKRQRNINQNHEETTGWYDPEVRSERPVKASRFKS